MKKRRQFATVQDILNAHAQFGPLDRAGVKKAMGPNWPKAWDKLRSGDGIFAARKR